jgi:hypothetical protein
VVDFSYRLTGTGWAEARLSDGDHSVALSASYLSDALGELLLAIACLQEGAQDAECFWEEEPGEYRWLLRRDGDSVVVTVVAFDDCWPHLPIDDREVVFTTRASLKEVATAVVTGCRAVLDDWGEEGYLKKWVEHPFPTELLEIVSAGAAGAGSIP